MRALTALVLCLVLAFASVSMAVARGQVPMGATVALCSEDGALLVALDAQGNPVPASPHLCPDCLGASTAVVLPEDAKLPARLPVVRLVTVLRPVLPGAGTAVIPCKARGPPGCSV